MAGRTRLGEAEFLIKEGKKTEYKNIVLAGQSCGRDQTQKRGGDVGIADGNSREDQKTLLGEKVQK